MLEIPHRRSPSCPIRDHSVLRRDLNQLSPLEFPSTTAFRDQSLNHYKSTFFPLDITEFCCVSWDIISPSPQLFFFVNYEQKSGTRKRLKQSSQVFQVELSQVPFKSNSMSAVLLAGTHHSNIGLIRCASLGKIVGKA